MKKPYVRVSEDPLLYRIDFPQKTKETYFDIYYDVGTLFEPEKYREYCHVFEHYILGSVQKKYGHELHRMNGEVGDDLLNFNFASDAKHLVRHVKLFLDELYGSDIEHRDVYEYERSSIESELRESWNEIGRQAWDKATEKIFGKKCPYFSLSESQISGIQKVRFESLKKFRKDFFLPLRPIFIYGGYGLGPETDRKMLELVRSYRYGNLRRTDMRFPECRPRLEKAYVIRHPGVRYGNFIRFFFPGYGLRDPIEKRIALAMLGEIFSGGSSMGIFKKIRSLGIYSFRSARSISETFGYFQLRSFITKQQAVPFIRTVLGHIKKIKKELVPRREISVLISRRKRNFLESWLSNNGRYNSICEDIVNGFPIYDPAAFNTVLGRITPKLLNEVANETFNFSKMKIIAIGNEVSKKDLLQR